MKCEGDLGNSEMWEKFPTSQLTTGTNKLSLDPIVATFTKSLSDERSCYGLC